MRTTVATAASSSAATTPILLTTRRPPHPACRCRLPFHHPTLFRRKTANRKKIQIAATHKMTDQAKDRRPTTALLLYICPIAHWKANAVDSTAAHIIHERNPIILFLRGETQMSSRMMLREANSPNTLNIRKYLSSFPRTTLPGR
ncbi:putative ankyrin repeat-containing protein [Iris pallida]|uniref:Ankyrin repeat-containing protein n=1 Tax=Iris pallida TaxID=29817 RepID=A0AAX6IG33_IRIPA|nr:putative ankyrin repeat-containing protein [Iris pallida]